MLVGVLVAVHLTVVINLYLQVAVLSFVQQAHQTKFAIVHPILLHLLHLHTVVVVVGVMQVAVPVLVAIIK